MKFKYYINTLNRYNSTKLNIYLFTGVIEFGLENSSLPTISYNDDDPLNINYFSFASWKGVEAKFLYDCPTSDDVSEYF